MDMIEIRAEIDKLDDTIKDAFKARMALSKEIAAYKKANGLPIFHPAREEEIIARLTTGESEEFSLEIDALYRKIFEISKDCQKALSKDYFLLGKSLSHSYSPRVHSLLGNGDYALLEKEEEELCELFSKRDFLGMNITIPYKERALDFCDVIDKNAAEIGSVNTVVNCEGSLFGTNTDYHGFIFMCRNKNVDFKDKNVLILGSGGTSKTVLAAAKNLGAASVSVVSRSGELNYENVYEKCADTEILVNTTPVGMYPDIYAAPVELSKFKRLSAVVDTVYNPLKTALILEAEKLSIKHTDPLLMLVAQAAAADTLFRGVRHGGTEVLKAAASLRSSLENIVLVGMPGSGKSSTGKLVAKQLGREFFDLDKLIIGKEGISITEIFEKYGEEYFRDRETEAVKEVASKSGVVISCGGGTVLREENRNALRHNGKVVYIKRELSSLSRKGRPLSKDDDAINQLYAVRAPIYEEFADITLSPPETAGKCAASIVRLTGAKK